MASNSTPHHSGNDSLIFIQGGLMKIPPKDLNIVWGKDDRYWKVPEDDSAAELYQVSWLEVTGVVKGMKAVNKCTVGFCVSLNPDAFGWGKHPLYIMMKKGKLGKTVNTKINVDPNQKGEFEIQGKWEKTAEDNSGDDEDQLYFGLYEAWSGKWKGGLKIHHAFIQDH